MRIDSVFCNFPVTLAVIQLSDSPVERMRAGSSHV